MRLTLVLFVTTSLAACGPLSPPKCDSGETPNNTGGSGGGASNTGGGTGGGTVGTGGGTGTFADGGVWSFGLVGGITTRWPEALVALQGTQGDLWALSSDGDLFHSTGGAFSVAVHFDTDKRDFARMGDLLVVADSKNLAWCRGAACTTDAAFTRQSIDAANGTSYGVMLCSDGDQVAAVGGNTLNPVYLWNGNGFTSLGNVGVSMDFSGRPKCWFDSAGRLIIPQYGGLMIVENGSSRVENLAEPGRVFLGGGEYEGVSWALGEYGHVHRKDPSGWVTVSMPVLSASYRAFAGFPSGERYVFGKEESGVNALAFRLDGPRIVPLSGFPSIGVHASFFRALVTANNEFFVVGTSDQGPFVLRATR